MNSKNDQYPVYMQHQFAHYITPPEPTITILIFARKKEKDNCFITKLAECKARLDGLYIQTKMKKKIVLLPN
jgi:hypothetical protein